LFFRLDQSLTDLHHALADLGDADADRKDLSQELRECKEDFVEYKVRGKVTQSSSLYASNLFEP
jgi:hypothetical protein